MVQWPMTCIILEHNKTNNQQLQRNKNKIYAIFRYTIVQQYNSSILNRNIKHTHTHKPGWAMEKSRKRKKQKGSNKIRTLHSISIL